MRLPPAGRLLLQHQQQQTPPLRPLSKLALNNKKTMPPNPQLPALVEVERLSPGCIRILAGNPGKFTLQGTNTYLVGNGARRLLIDTGEGRPSWIAALTRTLRDERATVDAAVLTHWHHDHTGGVPDLLRAWPGVKVYKKHQPEDEAEGGEQQKLLDIADGQTFRVPGASLTAVHTPGHTADHMVLAWEEEGALFTGDNVLGHGTAVFEDLAAYVASLEKMGRLFFGGKGGRAYPGHGAVVQDGPAKIAEYIRHRAQREEQVVQMLRADKADATLVQGVAAAGEGEGTGDDKNTWTVMELVRSIYRDVPESLHMAAAGGVVQVLQKLLREGKVVEVDDGERWKLVGRSVL
ncbi:beta-lactamase-like protein [Chaetomidium leptoderma]|uniref:Beta-lactamase-like protein n=1 Tax=Chaetomidium leptoderma TaxID=669021 RepID=A0AAN7A0C7_9PEZI|nr:beta-lactamase-like protein [Chaetomidium leptoderma]